jgi:hypothetical protein
MKWNERKSKGMKGNERKGEKELYKEERNGLIRREF